MSVTAGQYRLMAPLFMPLKMPDGFVYVELRFQCPVCDRELEEVHYEILPLSGCVELVFAGICRKDKSLVTCRFRHYGGGRILEDRDGTWTERRAIPTGLRKWKIWRWLRKLSGL